MKSEESSTQAQDALMQWEREISQVQKLQFSALIGCEWLRTKFGERGLYKV